MLDALNPNWRNSNWENPNIKRVSDTSIYYFISDLDGTITNGMYYIVPNFTEAVKQFHSRDFHGMQLLYSLYRINCCILTAATGQSIITQLDRTKETNPITLHDGIKDKYGFMRHRYYDSGLADWSAMAFIGDDTNDLELLSKVGVAACPSDADPVVLKLVSERPDGYVMQNKGGCGCVREFANLIMSFSYPVGIM